MPTSPEADFGRNSVYGGGMDHPHSIGQQISANFPDVLNSSEFSSERLWLTFFISAGPAGLGNLVEELKLRGWVNTQDWEYGWFWPKVESSKTFFDVLEACLLAEELCERHGAVLYDIDADTSPDVFQSTCVELYRQPSSLSGTETANCKLRRKRRIHTMLLIAACVLPVVTGLVWKIYDATDCTNQGGIVVAPLLSGQRCIDR